MARLQTSGSLSVSNINNLTGIGNIQTSLAARELSYMGGNPASASTSGVCFPNQLEKISSTDWTYNGASIAWRQTKMSEFYGAYTSLPQVTVVASARNNRRAEMFMTATGSNSDVGGPYSFFAENMQGGISGGDLNQWVIANANSNTSFSYTLSNNGSGTAILKVYVRDSLNCGTMKEFADTASYP